MVKLLFSLIVSMIIGSYAYSQSEAEGAEVAATTTEGHVNLREDPGNCCQGDTPQCTAGDDSCTESKPALNGDAAEAKTQETIGVESTKEQ